MCPVNIDVGYEEGLSALRRGQTIRQGPVGGVTPRTESIQRVQDEPGALGSIANTDVIPKTLTLDIWCSPLKRVLLWEEITPQRLIALRCIPALLLPILFGLAASPQVAVGLRGMVPPDQGSFHCSAVGDDE